MRRIFVSAIILLALILFIAIQSKAQNSTVNKDGSTAALSMLNENINPAKNLLPVTDLTKLSAASMQVFPNPVKGPLVTIQIETEQPGLHVVKLFNEFSKQLKTMNVTLVRGSQSILFELGELPPGYYSIQISGNFSKAMPLLVK
ncbi:MAG TPA: hypothetical protein PLO99_11460 [Chitinophagaceae bacterium]|jgi:hypothetical protein|nr:hypothetical protein [Chitinophagaceae bacterium]HRG92378.1 hypothetical protein [Chitinophagaceae bacterium]